MTARIALVVEGQTEQQFVAIVLAPYLLQHGVVAQPIGVQTSRTAAGVKRVGGGAWKHYEKDIRRLLGQHFDLVSTMLDFYGYPPDGPGAACCAGPHRARQCVEKREAEMTAAFDNPRFHPFVMLHEFETLVFGAALKADAVLGSSGLAAELQRQARTVDDDVELLNDSPQTAPSKRLASAWPDYSKTTDGVGIVSEAGVEAVMDACPHFASWVERLAAMSE